MTDTIPHVVEITLGKRYPFMYKNFVIATQHDTYLLLEKHNDIIDVLHFDSPQIKYGSPNDEARGGHPLAKCGLGSYGLFEVRNSPWIREQALANRVHPSHSDDMFEGMHHYIACFKDVMLEVTCDAYEEMQMSVSEVEALMQQQLEDLTK
jgi:hypothetical protein